MSQHTLIMLVRQASKMPKTVLLMDAQSLYVLAGSMRDTHV